MHKLTLHSLSHSLDPVVGLQVRESKSSGVKPMALCPWTMVHEIRSNDTGFCGFLALLLTYKNLLDPCAG